MKTDRRSGIIVHSVKICRGRLNKGDAVALSVEESRREMIQASHSCTHLLHEALRQRFGKQTAQRGSRNSPESLRFDFSRQKSLTIEDIEAIEDAVNRWIRQDSSVTTRIMTPEDALKIGAVALFEEKYGDEVRVVSMGIDDSSGKGRHGKSASIELCGGTHVSRTGQIGLFVITSESATAAGIRRIEALTGEQARHYLSQQDSTLARTALLLKTESKLVPGRVEELLEERRVLLADLETLRRTAAKSSASQQRRVLSIGSQQAAFIKLSETPPKELPGIVDDQKDQLGSGVAVVIAGNDGKALVAVGVTEDLTRSFSAVDIVRAITPSLGGSGGGGRADFARGGGSDPTGADNAFKIVEQIMEQGKMTAYWIAHVEVTDPETYGKYAEQATAAIAEHGGKFLARGGKSRCLEGQDRGRHVVVEFPDMASAVACYESAIYAKALEYSARSSVRDVIIVEGL